MQKTITIKRKEGDDCLFKEILQYQVEKEISSAPEAVRELCEYALKVKNINHHKEK